MRTHLSRFFLEISAAVEKEIVGKWRETRELIQQLANKNELCTLPNFTDARSGRYCFQFASNDSFANRLSEEC